jgi:enoyl-CoA hydratase/carnithine racemase
MSDVLKVDNLKEGVSILTLNRPEVLNSLNKELVDSLLDAFNKFMRIIL